MHPLTGLAEEQAMLRYLDAARQLHGDLQRVLTQVSGYALMLMTSRGPRTLPDAPILGAGAAAARAAEAARALAVPSGAGHHHHHLRAACAAVAHACAAATTCAGPVAAERDRDGLVAALQAAVGHLHAVSRLMPGFEPVNFAQACCAAHAAPAP
ncbi:MAG: hypothetical protein R3F55_01195 [Alphaproteobacteria bacterium]